MTSIVFDYEAINKGMREKGYPVAFAHKKPEEEPAREAPDDHGALYQQIIAIHNARQAAPSSSGSPAVGSFIRWFIDHNKPGIPLSKISASTFVRWKGFYNLMGLGLMPFPRWRKQAGQIMMVTKYSEAIKIYGEYLTTELRGRGYLVDGY